MKRILFFLVFLACIFCLIACGSSGEKDGSSTRPPLNVEIEDLPQSSEGLSFALNGDGKGYTVTGIGTCQESEIVIGSYRGLPVTTVGTNAFAETGITSVTLADCVQYIDTRAFYEALNLKALYGARGVKTIGEVAFCNCHNLVELPKFAWLERIDGHAFARCHSLEEVILPEGVTFIGEDAFREDFELKTVVLPNTLTFIGARAFLWDEALVYHETDNGYYLGNEDNPYAVLMKVKNTGVDSFTVHEDTIGVYDSAMEDCTVLSELHLHDGIRFLGYHVLRNCTSLRTLALPSQLTDLPEGAFYSCTALEQVTLPQGLKEIGRSAFYSCTNLTAIELPDTLTVIGSSAFSVCTSLKEVVIPSSVDRVGGSVFMSCTSLETVILEEGIRHLGGAVFYGCLALREVSLPSSLVSIGDAETSADTGPLFERYGIRTKGESISRICSIRPMTMRCISATRRIPIFSSSSRSTMNLPPVRFMRRRASSLPMPLTTQDS